MKVLLAATQIDEQGGGAAAAVRQLARGLQRMDVAVVLVGTHREGPLRQNTRDGILTYSFSPRNLYWIGDKDTKPVAMKAGFHLIDLWNPHVYRLLRSIIRREQPDIVHVNKLRGLSPAVWAAAGQAGAPGLALIHTCHDHELISPEGTLVGRLGEMATRGSRWLWPYQAMRRRLSRQVSAVTAPSRFTLDRHLALGYFPNAAVSVVPNSHGLSLAELEGLRTQLSGRPRNDPAGARLLYLGRLDSAKGIADLCAAFARALALRPELRLDVAGSGVLLEPLRQQYAHLTNIIFHGHVQGTAKRELLSAADALVVPSVGQEVFGIVIVEALAHGTPALAAATGGVPEVVREGETGYLFAPGEPDSLIETLVWAADHVAALRQMEPACFTAAAQYALETVAGAYYNTYRAALALPDDAMPVAWAK